MYQESQSDNNHILLKLNLIIESHITKIYQNYNENPIKQFKGKLKTAL